MYLLPDPQLRKAMQSIWEMLGKPEPPDSNKFYQMTEAFRHGPAPAIYNTTRSAQLIQAAAEATTSIALAPWRAFNSAFAAPALQEGEQPRLLSPLEFFSMASSFFTRRIQSVHDVARAKLAVMALMFNPRIEAPEWNIPSTPIFDKSDPNVVIDDVPITVEVMKDRKASQTLHFRKTYPPSQERKDPKVLIVVPDSGHWGTYVRNTVRDMLPDHDVHVLAMKNPRDVKGLGKFGLNNYTTMLMEAMDDFNGDVHVIGICQPGPALVAGVSLMHQINKALKAAGRKLLHPPKSLTLLASPINTGYQGLGDVKSSVVTRFADDTPMEYFETEAIAQVPYGYGYAGEGEWVRPGILQGLAFMVSKDELHDEAMEHYEGHVRMGHGEQARKVEANYDEFLAFKDIAGKLFTDTIRVVFKEKHLPKGIWKWSGKIAGMDFLDMLVKPSEITETALMTGEGKKDHITEESQCHHAHKLVTSIPDDMREEYTDPMAGHTGMFSSGRFSYHILPRIAAFMRRNDAQALQYSKRPEHRVVPGHHTKEHFVPIAA